MEWLGLYILNTLKGFIYTSKLNAFLLQKISLIHMPYTARTNHFISYPCPSSEGGDGKAIREENGSKEYH